MDKDKYHYFNDIPVLKWDDLDGKCLIIRVYEENSNKVIYGYDPIDGMMYILADDINVKDGW